MTLRTDGTEDYLPLGDLAPGFGEFKPPATLELGRQEVRLRFDDGTGITRLFFKDSTTLTWEREGDAAGEPSIAEETYEAFLVAPGLYFVDWVRRTRTPESFTLALDMGRGRATLVVSTLVRGETGRFRVNQDFRHACVHPPTPGFSVGPHERTGDLVGKRLVYTYSSVHTYEHIYLNEDRYTWHCLSGPEKGLADTERCATYKIAPDLYLFTWWERVVPCGAVVIVNLQQGRSYGKLFGLDDTAGVINFRMASYATVRRPTT